MVTFTKLQNGWGVKGPGLTPGAKVEVEKRDGSRTTVTIDRIVATTAGGWMAATIVATPAASRNTRANLAGYSSRSYRRSSCGCDCENCESGCQCDSTCNCRGGNIYDC